MNPRYDFTGQIVLVTGAAKGMGLATARMFADSGASVVLCDLDGEGNSPKGRLVIIEFDSMDQAKGSYNSPVDAQLRPVRQKAGRSNVYFVQGLAR